MEPVYGVHLGSVDANRDPKKLGRVRVVVPDLTTRGRWARVATLSAGPDRGTWFVPQVGDEVLVAFEAGDPRRPYVIGSLWNDAARPPATDPGRTVVREATIELQDTNGNGIALEPAGIRISAAAKVEVQASTLELTSSLTNVDSAIARFAGVVQADTLIANAVAAQSYTPGIGNIW